MSDLRVSVTVKCLMRAGRNGSVQCPWVLTATSLEEAASMHRQHIERQHS